MVFGVRDFHVPVWRGVSTVLRFCGCEYVGFGANTMLWRQSSPRDFTVALWRQSSPRVHPLLTLSGRQKAGRQTGRQAGRPVLRKKQDIPSIKSNIA